MPAGEGSRDACRERAPGRLGEASSSSSHLVPSSVREVRAERGARQAEDATPVRPGVHRASPPTQPPMGAGEEDARTTPLGGASRLEEPLTERAHQFL